MTWDGHAQPSILPDGRHDESSRDIIPFRANGQNVHQPFNPFLFCFPLFFVQMMPRAFKFILSSLDLYNIQRAKGLPNNLITVLTFRHHL